MVFEKYQFQEKNYDILNRIIKELNMTTHAMLNLLNTVETKIPLHRWLTNLDGVKVNHKKKLKSILKSDVDEIKTITHQQEGIWFLLLVEVCYSTENTIKIALSLLKYKLDWPLLYQKIAQLYNRIDNVKKAYYYCKLALEIDPNLQGVYSLLAEVSNYLGDTETLIDAYSHAVSLDPEDILTRSNYAVWLIQNNEPEKAVEQLEECLNIDQKDSFLWVQLNMAYHALGKNNDADASMKTAIELGYDPKKIDFQYFG